jgi:drug/metabolite transporter (DMT)-like permease
MVPVVLAIVATMTFSIHSAICRYVISNQRQGKLKS